MGVGVWETKGCLIRFTHFFESKFPDKKENVACRVYGYVNDFKLFSLDNPELIVCLKVYSKHSETLFDYEIPSQYLCNIKLLSKKDLLRWQLKYGTIVTK